MNNNYNVLYNNRLNRVIINKNKNNKNNPNNSNKTPESPIKKIDYSEEENKEFQKKIDELRKFANIDEVKDINLGSEKIKTNNLPVIKDKEIKSFEKYVKQNLIYGIKKTILSDMNHLYQSSNSNDFKIGLNKKGNQKGDVFDCFYLFPNISEINTKSETNIINEKIVKYFDNKNESYDNQYFPLDFVAPGITVPLKKKNTVYSKLIIKNIYWNIFQSINIDNYTNDELLCYVPDKNDFAYKKIKLHVNFELHAQVSNTTINMFSDKILPYRTEQLKNICPANTCLFKSVPIEMGNLNGSYFEDIEIDLLKELNIDCCLLCLKISVPNYCIDLLKGFDKNNKVFTGYINFSQIIVNFDYELQ